MIKKDFFKMEKNVVDQMDYETLAIAFARCFQTVSGQKVLAHLIKITRGRVLGCEASDAELRFVEGQRALVAQIEAFINQGKNGRYGLTNKGEENG